jgi:hypothetical protein
VFTFDIVSKLHFIWHSGEEINIEPDAKRSTDNESAKSLSTGGDTEKVVVRGLDEHGYLQV